MPKRLPRFPSEASRLHARVLGFHGKIEIAQIDELQTREDFCLRRFPDNSFAPEQQTYKESCRPGWLSIIVTIMRFSDACLQFDPSFAQGFHAAIHRFQQDGLLDAKRYRALRLEERFEFNAWNDVAHAVVGKLSSSAADMYLCFGQALAPHRASAPPLKCAPPKLLARVQKLDPLAKRTLSSTEPLVSRRRAAADTGRLLRTEAQFTSPTWGAFDEADSSRDPFGSMTSASEIVCRLALGYTDNPREVFIILYTLPEYVEPKIPTLAHAISIYIKDGVTNAGWHQHFSPTPATALWGRTRPVAPYRCEKGVPETVHGPVPLDYIRQTRRMTYA